MEREGKQRERKSKIISREIHHLWPYLISSLILSTITSWLILSTVFFRGEGSSLQTNRKTEIDHGTLKRSDHLQIIYLTDHRLSRDELRLLQKELGFVPTTRFDVFVWLKDIDLFVQKIKWRKFSNKIMPVNVSNSV